MKNPLRILHLEDDPRDAALIHKTLQADGIFCEATYVRTRGEFLAALEYGGIDLVLSDFSLPAFDGASATELVRARWPDLPFILVAGRLGEELAIDSLKRGATDYVLKDRLSRLAPAVRRAIEEVDARAERRKLEAQVIESQKMEVIGQLAGGVAHDFNNILGVIMGYSDLLTADLGPQSPLLRYTEEIRHASERAAGLTRQLLVFSSKETVQSVVLDLNDVITELKGMLRRLIDENIEMVILPGEHLGRIRADSGYMGQVLMNLVVNARDAMPQGGKVTISTAEVTLDEPPLPAGKYIRLSVTDTGTGIAPEVQKRLFEPFFTTKGIGKGTGLGLATCQTIVKQSGGRIVVRSELGNGTAFDVYFPWVDEPLEAPTREAAGAPPPGGTETLLVVEDEPSVRHLAQGVLQAHGYQVLSGSNGQDGLHVAREHTGARIALVVSDIMMPLMSGPVMAEWLKTKDPDLKVLFTSGYSDEAIAHRGILNPGVEFLAKPYTPAMLLRRVRALLDS